MLLLVISSFIFGLSHPLGALLVEDTDPLIFTFHFLLMLTLIQLPFVLLRWREVKKLKFSGGFDLLLLSGLVGTFLYWCEFSSLQVDIPVSHVTFILLTVPAWALLWEFLRGRGTKTNINKWVLALIGSFILISPNDKGQFSIAYMLPIFTSLLSACWLIYSKKCQEAGIHPIVCTFFNDLFSLVGVLGFILINGKGHSLVIPENVGNIFLYSAIIGVVPNILLFYGLRSTGIVAASSVIMLEPVISGLLSVVINNDILGANFLVGAVFITLSNLPANFSFHFERMRIAYERIWLED
jgi:drug/metabolite transporter (DMT)-like permease